jgi:FkbM family methyltransferase
MLLRETAHALVWAYRHRTGQLEPPELSVMAHWISAGDTCLDIGAHGGAWMVPLSRLVGPQGHVLAVEALPYYARVLGLTRQLLGCTNATLRNLAITEDGRPVRMVWKDASGAPLTGRTHIAGLGETLDGAVEIAGTTLDAICAGVTSRVSFIKIDIEGAELGALRGGLLTLGRHRPLVLSEVVNEHLGRYGYSSSDLFDFFAALEYLPFALHGGRTSPVSLQEAAQYNDLVFAPRESAFAAQADGCAGNPDG